MVLLDLISETSYSFAVAHCNFQLRGEESDLDEKLVKSTCEELKVTFHKIRFDTKKHARELGISTQMAARDLRFAWFESLCDEFQYDKIVLAHHLDDSIETFFLNLSRGTSLKGLRGIQPENNRLVRPLLAFTKNEIIQYAKSEGLKWREDASNQETYYKRNLIRHELLPVLKKLNPDFEKVMNENLEKLAYRFQTSQKYYDGLIKDLVLPFERGVKLDIKSVLQKCENPYDLYEVLRDFHFNYATIQDLYLSMEVKSVGKIFKSEEYQLLLDREELVISANKPKEIPMADLKVDSIDDRLTIGNQAYRISKLDIDHWTLDTNSKNGAFDYDKLQFPLTVRSWQVGDHLQPIGMKGRKLVSDLLIDLKVPLTEKAKVFVLLSGEKIAWVIGHRISDKFKVTRHTKKVWVMKAAKTSH